MPPKKEKKKAQTYSLTETAHAIINTIAAEQGISQAAVIELSLRVYAAKYQTSTGVAERLYNSGNQS